MLTVKDIEIERPARPALKLSLFMIANKAAIMVIKFPILNFIKTFF